MRFHLALLAAPLLACFSSDVTASVRGLGEELELGLELGDELLEETPQPTGGNEEDLLKLELNTEETEPEEIIEEYEYNVTTTMKIEDSAIGCLSELLKIKVPVIGNTYNSEVAGTGEDWGKVEEVTYVLEDWNDDGSTRGRLRHGRELRRRWRIIYRMNRRRRLNGGDDSDGGRRLELEDEEKIENVLREQTPEELWIQGELEKDLDSSSCFKHAPDDFVIETKFQKIEESS